MRCARSAAAKRRPSAPANLAEVQPDEPHRDDQVRQASAEEDADTEPAGDLGPVPVSEPLPEPLEGIPELTP
jgi:hypothetical protein